MYVSIAVVHLTFAVTFPIFHGALVVTTTLVIKVCGLILIRVHFAVFERPHIPILLAPVGPSKDSWARKQVVFEVPGVFSAVIEELGTLSSGFPFRELCCPDDSIREDLDTLCFIFVKFTDENDSVIPSSHSHPVCFTVLQITYIGAIVMVVQLTEAILQLTVFKDPSHSPSYRPILEVKLTLTIFFTVLKRADIHRAALEYFQPDS